jgi:hypothetical protein
MATTGNRRIGQFRHVVAVAVTAALLGGLGVAPTALAIVGTPTTTTVDWPTNPVPANNQFQTVTIHVAPVPSGGTATLYWDNSGTPVVQSAGLVDPATGIVSVNLVSAPLLAGSYDMYAKFTGGGSFSDSTSATHAVVISLVANPIALDVTDATLHIGQDAALHAATTHYASSIQLWDQYNGGTPVMVAEQTPQNMGVGDGVETWFTVPAPALGTHVYVAIALANDVYAEGTSSETSVAVTKWPTAVGLVSLETPYGGHPFLVSLGIQGNDPPASIPDVTGMATVKEGSTVLASCDLSVGSGSCQTSLTLPAGDHSLTVEYAGDGKYAPDTTPVDLPVGVDFVDVSGVGLNYTTFYPYKDGYRDTVTAHGTRNESISITIKVLSPAGKTLKTASIAAGTGAYAWTWTGKNASGTMYPAGKYRIVQTLKDGNGTVKTVTTYVTISAKRLYTYTKAIIKDYAHREAQGTYTVAWAFTLPSATIYKKLVFAVYGKSGTGGGLGPHDFTACSKSTLSTACATRSAGVGFTNGWYSVTGSPSHDRSGTFVRLYAASSTRTWLKQGRVTVTYQILK